MKDLTTVALYLAMVVITSHAWAGEDFDMQQACDGKGIAGWLKEEGIVVHFESCETPDGGHSKIWSDETGFMTTVLVEGDRMDYAVNGVDVAIADADEEQIARAFETIEAEVIRRRLWQEIRKAGVSEAPSPVALRALAANLTGYETGVDGCGESGLDKDCTGCCGPACWGCTGCYTEECGAHDRCVKDFGTIACLHKLFDAAWSAWKCVK